jgi:hypothetical protein
MEETPFEFVFDNCGRNIATVDPELTIQFENLVNVNPDIEVIDCAIGYASSLYKLARFIMTNYATTNHRYIVFDLSQERASCFS